MTTLEGNSFTKYEEPNNWEEVYKPYQTEWFKQVNPNPKVPLYYTKKAQNTEPEYLQLRKEIVQESLQIDKIGCPFYSIHDQSIDWSATGKLMLEEQNNNEVVENALFTIRKDEEENV